MGPGRRCAWPLSSVWRQEDESLIRDYEFEDFAAAMAFVNQVAEAAEEANHHPDILVHGWNKVRLTLTTHDDGRADRQGPCDGRAHRRYPRHVALMKRRPSSK